MSELARELQAAQMRFGNTLSARASAAGVVNQARATFEQAKADLAESERRLQIAEQRAAEAKEFLGRIDRQHSAEARLEAARRQRTEAVQGAHQRQAEAEARLAAAQKEATDASLNLACIVGGEG
jgi:hypothetical protein